MDTKAQRFFALVAVSVLYFGFASSRKVALLIIDVQNCFLPGGSLGVNEGDHVIPIINNIRYQFESRLSLVVLSQDWHCGDHVSFASQHPNSSAATILQYDKEGNLCTQENPCLKVTYNITQVLWPDHCVINTTSAEFSSELIHKSTDTVVRKGYHCQVDSYSAFYDNGGFLQTELHSTLQSAEIDTVIITGLATDYCVKYTAIDAKKLSYGTYVVVDATRPVANDTGETAIADMRSKGIHIVSYKDLPMIMKDITSDASRHMIFSTFSILFLYVWFVF